MVQYKEQDLHSQTGGLQVSCASPLLLGNHLTLSLGFLSLWGSLPGVAPLRSPRRALGSRVCAASTSLRSARRDRAEPRGPLRPGHERSRMMRSCLGRCSRRRRRRRSGGAAAPGDPARASGEWGWLGRAGFSLPGFPATPCPLLSLLYTAAYLRPSRISWGALLCLHLTFPGVFLSLLS